MSVGQTVLVVEDDEELRSLLGRGLLEEGFVVEAVGTGADALARTGQTDVDALVIDIGLPDADGRDLCQALRARGMQTPVLFLTARDALVDRIAGFDAGGDDYLPKPFAFAELVVRLRVLLRRASADGTVQAAALRLDPDFAEEPNREAAGRISQSGLRLLRFHAHSNRHSNEPWPV